MKCYWWNRWYHRRLRRIDEEVMLVAIVESAKKHGIEADSELIDIAWANFTCQPGQEHWHCECALKEL